MHLSFSFFSVILEPSFFPFPEAPLVRLITQTSTKASIANMNYTNSQGLAYDEADNEAFYQLLYTSIMHFFKENQEEEEQAAAAAARQLQGNYSLLQRANQYLELQDQ